MSSGPVCLEGEAALGLIELHGRHAHVHGHTVDRLRQRVRHGRELGLDQRQRVHGLGAAGGDGVGIAIESDHARAPGEERARVPTRPEGRVHHQLAGGRSESGYDLIEEDRDVVGGAAHSCTPFSAM
jgi:hypothetical protein